ncbi:Lipoma HMGIC fusion partner-like protein [Popillia japonica]|uniref:Lipoma HMGIC fusion partner-like protein n=1 Tax=Popillia japonica TaxID=7064 RepID=A0AAW1KL18_POPJA
MGSKIEYVDSTQIYATSYVRNSKAIGVLWAIFTICYAIIGVVSFVTPEWIGNISGDSPGKFGLWSTCYADEQCKGKLEEILSIANIPFMAATICVGLAVLTALLTIFAMLFFCFCQTTTVFHICAWLQLISAVCMIGGCASFPAGWSEVDVQKICGDSDRYVLGKCGIRWAYLLAAIGCLDAVILSILAFILATRHIRLQPDPHYAPASLFKDLHLLAKNYLDEKCRNVGRFNDNMPGIEWLYSLLNCHKEKVSKKVAANTKRARANVSRETVNKYFDHLKETLKDVLVDWFCSNFLPHAKKLPGRKILLSNNLSSHFTDTMIQLCQENNNSFVCLPKHSTLLTQFLDVGFFRPFKMARKSVLNEWKVAHP